MFACSVHYIVYLIVQNVNIVCMVTGDHTDSTVTSIPKVETMAQTAIQQATLPTKATR